MDEGLLNDYSHVEDGVNDDDGIAMHQSRKYIDIDIGEIIAYFGVGATGIVGRAQNVSFYARSWYAEGPVKFCKSIGHVFDSVVVLTSWVFEVFFAEEEAMALIIVFRLWRVIRIVHGIVETSQSKLKAKIDKLQRQVTELEDRLRSRNSDLQREKDLRALVEDREKTYRKRLEDNERNRAGSARPHSMQVVGTTTNTSDIDIDTNMRPITPTSTTAGAGDATGDLGLDHLDSPTESQLRQARARLQTSPHEERAAMMGEQLKDGDQ